MHGCMYMYTHTRFSQSTLNETYFIKGGGQPPPGDIKILIDFQRDLLHKRSTLIEGPVYIYIYVYIHIYIYIYITKNVNT